MRLFLSGPITGVQLYRDNFNQAESTLKKHGFEVANPVDIRSGGAWEWSDWMRATLTLMLTCDGVACLGGWNYSKGAQIEVALAESLGMPVRLVTDWLGELDR